MTDQREHGRVEQERRWLLSALPEGPWDQEARCVDRYGTGPRQSHVSPLVEELPPSTSCVHATAGTSAQVVYRRIYVMDAWRVDVFEGALEGLVMAVIQSDDPRQLARAVPPFPVVREVTSDPNYDGAALASRAAPPLEALVHGWLAASQYDETRAALSQLPSSVEHAAAWMLVLHRYQSPRHDGRPYLSHPAEVALRVAQWGGDGVQIAAALLHDALEDQAERISPDGDAPDVLEAVMGAEVRQLVEALTHPSGAEGYLAYIRSLSPRALDIKVADLSTNALRVEHVQDDARRDYLTRKYAPAMCWLASRMDGHPAEPVFQAAVHNIFAAVRP